MIIQQQIQQRIHAFAAELEQLVRAAAVQSVSHALGGHASAAPHPQSKAPASAAPRARGKSGGKRDPKVLAATVEKAAEWVKANPGKGVEAMAAGLKLKTKDLALPIAKLLDAKTIKKTGVKRATKYYPR